MLSKYFFTALKKITAHAQNFSSTLYVFDYKRNEDGLSELKILVSVVRFQSRPKLRLWCEGAFGKDSWCSGDRAIIFIKKFLTSESSFDLMSC